LIEEQDIALTPGELQNFYSLHFFYFNTLNSRYKGIFASRCLQFISKKIISGNELEITNAMRAMLAASAIQLTLGLETWNLNYFETLIIYPEDFDGNNGLKYRGETNTDGFIKLSWKSFIHGYKVTNDKINLGIHEFSHALRLNNIRGFEQDYFIEHYFDSWLASAYEAYYDVKNNRKNVFRKYGGTNMIEFISVCIEHYFESPEDIMETYPRLYFSTAILLNQKTEKGATELGIRKTMLLKKNSILPGFSDHVLKSSYLHSNLFKVLMIISATLIFNIFSTGVFSGVTFLFINLCLLLYLCFDFRFTRVKFLGKQFVVERGILFFKWRRKLTLPTAQLISVRALTDSKFNEAWEIIFYNDINEFFYEEKIYSFRSDTQVFIKELVSNKVAYFR
jgi:MtfA peptidase